MKISKLDNNCLPTILIVQDDESDRAFESSFLNLFDTVYISKSQNYIMTLSWIQQNQPDLIILRLKKAELPCLSLITSLKMDWLTRDIPTVVIGNRLAVQSVSNLDYDACLTTPYSAKDLTRVICSFVHSPLCQIFA